MLKCFFMFYCNIRSFLKNLFLLSEFLYFVNCKFDILVVIEMRLLICIVINVDIFNYDFFYINLLIQVGGFGLYILKNFNVIY